MSFDNNPELEDGPEMLEEDGGTAGLDAKNRDVSFDFFEVELEKPFGVVAETLSRMGIINHDDKKVWPSCYCVSGEQINLDPDKYYIVHFMQLFEMEGKESSMNEEDFLRLKTIVYFVDKWGLVNSKEDIDEILAKPIQVLKHEDKDDYEIEHKYEFRTKTRKVN